MTERLNALVLEDEWPARNYLVQLLERTGQVHVVAAVPTPALATEALRASPEPIDVAFVDVTLVGAPSPDYAGLTWVEHTTALAKSDPAMRGMRFVLTTASEDHALRAYQLGVSDYLLKPFAEERVLGAVERLLEARPIVRAATTVGAHRIAARDGRAIVFLRRDEVFAFEAEGRLCFVHSTRGRLDVDLSLTSLESVLGAEFLRVHRGWLVSLDHVVSIDREGGETVLFVGNAAAPVRVSVARDRAVVVREQLLSRSVGIRRDG